MQLVTLTEAIPGEGYAEGHTISVDELSAAALIKAGKATAVEVSEDDAVVGEAVETIDDIVDPGVAAKRSQMAATIVGGVDPGPRPAAKAEPAEPAKDADTNVEVVEVTADAKAPEATPADAPKAKAASPASAAPGPNPAGAVAGGAPRG